MTGRTRTILIIVIAVVVVAGAAGAVWYFTWQNGREASYKRDVTARWNDISKKASSVSEKMGSVSSPADLTALAAATESLRKTVGEAKNKAASNPPGSDGKVNSLQKDALASLDSYLSALSNAASTADKAKFLADTQLLSNAGFQTRLDVTSFLSAVPYVDVNFPANFYQAGAVVGESLSNEGARKSDAKAVVAAADAFIAADVKQFNPETIWSLLSSRSQAALGLFGINKEVLSANWPNQRPAGKIPTGYFIDPVVNFTGPDSATVKVMMYYKKDSPQTEDQRLVREGGQWKIDGYVFNSIP